LELSGLTTAVPVRSMSVCGDMNINEFNASINESLYLVSMLVMELFLHLPELRLPTCIVAVRLQASTLSSSRS
jgi:hypothetical protein